MRPGAVFRGIVATTRLGTSLKRVHTNCLAINNRSVRARTGVTQGAVARAKQETWTIK